MEEGMQTRARRARYAGDRDGSEADLDEVAETLARLHSVPADQILEHLNARGVPLHCSCQGGGHVRVTGFTLAFSFVEGFPLYGWIGWKGVGPGA